MSTVVRNARVQTFTKVVDGFVDRCLLLLFKYIFIMLSYTKYTHTKEKVHKKEKKEKKTLNY